MKIHRIKLNKEFCDAVNNKDKTFEVRRNDRGYQKGDHVRFIPVDNVANRIYHPVEDKEYEISYVLNGYGIENGYVAFSIKEVRL